jgi:hypothetical protein
MTHSIYPSFEHLLDPTNHAEAVVEARIINDMKSHLSENEFWQVVEHLFAVGLEKGKIRPPFGKRLPKGWSPARHYIKRVLGQGPTQTCELLPPAVSKLSSKAPSTSHARPLAITSRPSI